MKQHHILAAVIMALAGLGGCSDITLPVAVIGPTGHILRGTATAHMNGDGTFEASDGKLRCAGTYDALSTSPTISFPVQCSNGLKGLGTAVRETSGLAGSGSIRMSDGTDWRFVFGKAATTF